MGERTLYARDDLAGVELPQLEAFVVRPLPRRGLGEHKVARMDGDSVALVVL